VKQLLRLFLALLGIVGAIGLLTSPWKLWGQPEPEKSIPSF
jgi:hypothetical protein